MEKRISSVILVMTDGTVKSASRRSGFDDCVDLMEHGVIPCIELTGLHDYPAISKIYDPDYSANAADGITIVQSRKDSFLEANANTFIGFIVSVMTWSFLVPIIFPELEPYSGIETSIYITLIFTVISIMRNYFVRRAFNWWVK